MGKKKSNKRAVSFSKSLEKKVVKKHKYNAIQVDCDGYKFASKLEYSRYLWLKEWLRNGKILNLEVHPRYDLHTINDTKVCVYEADFRYSVQGEPSKAVVEDVKGFRTDIFKLKKKWIKLEHGIEVREVTADLIHIPPWAWNSLNPT